ncbi:hypothetical protein [Streptomyces sp. NPDC087525]|uniref:hypothetical protein n=1 Tax=Streptomyces sp. NPDC087525 TaxID=3365793 RepID=UPI003815F5A3
MPRPYPNSPTTSGPWRFDADTGRSDVVPDAQARGTKLRRSTRKLIAAANAKSGANLAPVPIKPGPAMAAAAAGPKPPAPAVPVERRTPPPGRSD